MIDRECNKNVFELWHIEQLQHFSERNIQNRHVAHVS